MRRIGPFGIPDADPVRLTFTDGTVLEASAEEWRCYPGDKPTVAQFKRLRSFKPGELIYPDSPNGPVKEVARIDHPREMRQENP